MCASNVRPEKYVVNRENKVRKSKENMRPEAAISARLTGKSPLQASIHAVLRHAVQHDDLRET
jgi:hypothetical protein